MNSSISSQYKRLVRVLVALLGLAFAASTGAATSPDASQFFSLNTGDFRAEAADARAEGKKALLVMFEQEGCPGCLYMKRSVLSRKDVQDFYRRHFVNFTVDIWGAVPLRDFTARDSTEKAFAQAAKVKGTPTFVFYDLAGQEIVHILGPIEDPAEFMLLGEFVASGAYKTRSFAQYKTQIRKGG